MGDLDCGDKGGERERRRPPGRARHFARDELGLPRLRPDSVRALCSGDLPSLWLGGSPSWYALRPAPCADCKRAVFESALQHASGARLDVGLGEGSFVLFAHSCRVGGKAVAT